MMMIEDDAARAESEGNDTRTPGPSPRGENERKGGGSVRACLV